MKNKFNIIFIVGDALRRDKLGCYGYDKPTSPVIDKLAKEGVIFENAFACSNHTDSSITSMTTGKYPITHGILHHGKRVATTELEIFNNTDAKMLAEILNSNDFITLGFDWLGRWHKKGYNYYGEIGPHPTIESKLEEKIDGLTESDEMKKKLKIMLHKIGFHLPGRCGIYYTRQAIKLIKKNSDKNFFLFIHNWDTHTPFDIIPETYKEKFYDGSGKKKVADMLKKIKNKKWREVVRDYHLYGIEYLEEIPALYDAAVNLFDDSIKELLECLEKKNTLDKTIIIITGDHGDNPLYDGVFIGHFGLYDPVIHVPLILWGNGLPKGKKVKQFVQHIDLFPTLLDLIGLEYEEFDLDGESLLPLINGRTKKIRDSVLTSDGASRKRFAIRTKKYKFIYAPTSKERIIPFDTIGNRYKEELYDLIDDPEERKNLVNIKKDKAKELKEKLLNKIDELEKKKINLIEKYKKRERTKIQDAIKTIKI